MRRHQASRRADEIGPDLRDSDWRASVGPAFERWGSRGRRFKSCRPDQRFRSSEAVSAGSGGGLCRFWGGSGLGALWERSCSHSQIGQPGPVCPSPDRVDLARRTRRYRAVGRRRQPSVPRVARMGIDAPHIERPKDPLTVLTVGAAMAASHRTPPAAPRPTAFIVSSGAVDTGRR